MLLKLSAAYAMFIELIVVAILVYLQLEVKEIVILGLMTYAALFFFYGAEYLAYAILVVGTIDLDLLLHCMIQCGCLVTRNE